MARPRSDVPDEQPLDPAVERIRRRLVRFAAINIGILFIALMVVLGAIVYKTNQFGQKSAQPATAASPAVPSSGDLVEGRIALPAGARIVSQTLSGSRLSLQIEHRDGSQAILVYDVDTGRLAAHYSIVQDQ